MAASPGTQQPDLAREIALFVACAGKRPAHSFK
jgi:hypothetical protein